MIGKKVKYLNVCEPVHDDHLQRPLPHLISRTYLLFKRASYLTGRKTFIQVMTSESKVYLVCNWESNIPGHSFNLNPQTYWHHSLRNLCSLLLTLLDYKWSSEIKICILFPAVCVQMLFANSDIYWTPTCTKHCGGSGKQKQPCKLWKVLLT